MRLYEIFNDEYTYCFLMEGKVEELLKKRRNQVKSKKDFFDLVKFISKGAKLPLAFVLSIALTTFFPNQSHQSHAQSAPSQQHHVYDASKDTSQLTDLELHAIANKKIQDEQRKEISQQEINDFLQRNNPAACTKQKAGTISCQHGSRCKCATYPVGATMLGLPPGASRWECRPEYGSCS